MSTKKTVKLKQFFGLFWLRGDLRHTNLIVSDCVDAGNWEILTVVDATNFRPEML